MEPKGLEPPLQIFWPWGSFSQQPHNNSSCILCPRNKANCEKLGHCTDPTGWAYNTSADTLVGWGGGSPTSWHLDHGTLYAQTGRTPSIFSASQRLWSLIASNNKMCYIDWHKKLQHNQRINIKEIYTKLSSTYVYLNCTRKTINTSDPYICTVLYGLTAISISPMYVWKQSKQLIYS